ncbi:virA/G regulated protein [Agrobacterium tumefaciens]|uniref:Protein virB3 n=1 Tax=Agrobacterium larrymoorei TaxID=160699 RepID=A0A2Z2Q406_9HYPH|nr:MULTISPECIES: virA/G regulated protein [Agrobacterium]ASK49550.1 protein virB3 [Agrobacterium larrymoorei]NSZ03077.1 virA/G regulated protein [Agrobacterium tumefaciens]NSZ39692.1 virA/G regulated protein [Agrobacterium tumefaciens]NTB05542.1 virA/G regulated protein [Agrobacterium tumefaciens]NTB26650.1 virA/G regulated protein [Agrobacterium tumefaciens]
MTGKSKVHIRGSADALPDVPGGSTTAPFLTEPSRDQVDASFEVQTDYSQSTSVSFTYDGVGLGPAERAAYENWCEPGRPTWKDLIIKARVDPIDDVTWLRDLEEDTPSTFRYEGMPLGIGERQAYENWQEDAQPTWEDLVVSARLTELGRPHGITGEYTSLAGSKNTSSISLKRKRSNLIDDENSSGSFSYDGMKLGEAERSAYGDWAEAEPPTWKDLVLRARVSSINDSAWLFDSQTSSSSFEYNGVPLGEPERQSLRQWQGDAQPTWEDLVVNARMAELCHAGWIEGQKGCFEERGEALPASERGSQRPIGQRTDSSDSFVYDGTRLGAPERTAYERWSKRERPTWEDLILDAHQARTESDAVTTQAIGQSSSPVFLYEGKSLGDRERKAYEKWRQPAQPRWQNLVVNARLAEIDPSAWIADERDPLDDSDALGRPSYTSLTDRSDVPLDDQSIYRRSDLVREQVPESSQRQFAACSESETRPVQWFTASGSDANNTENITASDPVDRTGGVKRLGSKSDRTVTASIHDVNSSTRRLLLNEFGSEAPRPSPEKTVRLRSDNIGTYGSRKNERARLATETGAYESEHIFGFKAVHDTARATKEGRRLERPMPAYLEDKGLHRQHIGTGRGRTKLVGRGWPDDTSYRSDQRATLSDPVARSEGATASNGYQLNQLGYAHQLASDGLQSESPDGVALPIQVATTSYNYTVSRDPVLVPPDKNEAPQLLHLGPRGQTEAVLARETALTGKWPTLEREQQVYREFLALYDVKKDLEAKSVGVRRKKKEVISALDRTARLISTSPSKARSKAETEKAIDELDDRRVYDPRDRAQDKAFKR